MKRIFSIITFLLIILGATAQDDPPAGTVIDEVVAVVGKNYILLSDIEGQYIQMKMQGDVRKSESATKCEILEGLLFEKLLLHQAALDSVEVSPEEVDAEIDQRMRYFIQQFGSQEKLEKYYGKTVTEFRTELRQIMTEKLMVQKVQSSITQNTRVSPSEVKSFYKKMPKDSIPLISSEVVVAQIVKKPPISFQEKFEVKERLRKMRERVLKGESFEALAVMYSEDPGSAKQGGDIGLHGRGELYPEFEAVAFKMKPGDVSDIVESEAGYHIIQGVERRGDFVRVRHILIKPKVSPVELAEARNFLDSIAQLIRQDSITFEDAVQKFSTDASKVNGGILINPNSGRTQWSVDELDPKVFFIIDKMSVNEISTPILMQDEKGEDAYRILQLKSRSQPHRANLEEDYDYIQNLAMQMKQQETIIEWIKNNAKKSYININEKYDDCAFEQSWF